MKDYKGFITIEAFREVKDSMNKISDFRQIINILEHMKSPDTNAEDKLCESFQELKEFIVLALNGKIIQITKLIKKLLLMEEDR